MNQIKTLNIGGISGIIEAILYIIGFAFMLTILSPLADESIGETEKLNFIIENKLLFQIWHLLIYVLFGIVLVPLTLAINSKFQASSFIGAQVTPIFGFIWSGLVIASGMIINVGVEAIAQSYTDSPESALASWRTIEAIHNGLGGGVEIVGGLWVLLISLSGITQSVFPRALNFFGIVVGAAGVFTAIPGLEVLGAIFGLTQIIWFLWIGISMLREKSRN